MPQQRIPRTTEDLEDQFQSQVQLLKNACQQFDDGYMMEAKNIALRIRVFLHNTKNSHSLLTQLGKENIRFFNTAKTYDPLNLVTTHSLVGIRISTERGNSFFPLLGPKINYISFDDWWKQRIVVKDKFGCKFTREDLILFLANQDGGGHIDPSINRIFHDLTRTNSIGWEPPMKYFIENCVRQIGYELLKTLENNFLD